MYSVYEKIQKDPKSPMVLQVRGEGLTRREAGLLASDIGRGKAVVYAYGCFRYAFGG